MIETKPALLLYVGAALYALCFPSVDQVWVEGSSSSSSEEGMGWLGCIKNNGGMGS